MLCSILCFVVSSSNLVVESSSFSTGSSFTSFLSEISSVSVICFFTLSSSLRCAASFDESLFSSFNSSFTFILLCFSLSPLSKGFKVSLFLLLFSVISFLLFVKASAEVFSSNWSLLWKSISSFSNLFSFSLILFSASRLTSVTVDSSSRSADTSSEKELPLSPVTLSLTTFNTVISIGFWESSASGDTCSSFFSLLLLLETSLSILPSLSIFSCFSSWISSIGANPSSISSKITSGGLSSVWSTSSSLLSVWSVLCISSVCFCIFSSLELITFSFAFIDCFSETTVPFSLDATCSASSAITFQRLNTERVKSILITNSRLGNK